MAKAGWQTLSLKPLNGVLDTRSRPSDPPLGGYRWRQNFRLSDQKKLCRMDGFSKLFPGNLFDDLGVSLSDPDRPGTGVYYHNDDHHQQGASRQPITFLFESTANDGTRRLFDGTQSRISVYNPATGYWSDIATGYGDAGTRWKAAQLQDVIVFTNNHDQVLYHELGTGGTAGIPSLANSPFAENQPGKQLSQAAVVVEFTGVIMLMNVVQDGLRKSSRVVWSDLNKPTDFDVGSPSTVAGFQDLDYGDDILAAAQMGGVLLIYTRRSIWKCFATGDSTTVFGFQKIYSEPKNQARCIAFPNTLVSDGTNHYYLGRDGLYHFGPYLAAPERGDEKGSEFTWAHQATGVIFDNAATRINTERCSAPVAELVPATKELWISWPTSGVIDNNNWTLVLNLNQEAASVVDTGFTAFVNYRPGEATNETCNEDQVFIGSSGRDYCLKQFGGVFSREFVTIVSDNLALDISEPVYFTEGYYSILRGVIPTGYHDREKIIREVAVDGVVADQDDPCALRCRIGNSFKLVDPNDTSSKCVPIWRQADDQSLECLDESTIAQMQAENQRPDEGWMFPVYEQGRFLYFELTIANEDGSKAIGGDVCFDRIDFDVFLMP